MKSNAAREVVKQFWFLMGTNEFFRLADVLCSDFVLEWPQSKERVRGAEDFIKVNEEYPAKGPWEFTINRIVSSDSEVVTDVHVTDGVTHARSIAFFSVRDDRICRIVEFWPDDYEPPENRSHLVERIY